MDFLGVCDSGEWGDTSDAKDLHSKLFSPQTGAVGARPKSKKSKATRKKQATPTVGEKQSDSTDIKKPRKNQMSAKLQHGSVKETETSGTSVEHEKVTTKKKKKRKMDASESKVPVKKKKAKKALPSTATPVAQGEQNKELKSQQNDDNETLGEDRTINVDQIKKKRKRKPRNNKFKTAEFGYVAKPSETRTLDAESEIRNQNGKSIAQTLEVKGEVKDGNKKFGKKRSKKRKVKKPAKTEINQRTPSKNNVDQTKDKSEGAQLSSPVDKVKKKASENLDQKSKTENEVSKERTKQNKKMIKANVKIDSQLSKEKIEPVDRQCEHLKSATKCEKLDGDKLATSQDEDISEEPLPDLSAKQALKSKMEAKLQSAHFRFLNERLYKTTGSEAQQMMAQDRESFDIYHLGFAQQVRQWPVNPVDKFIEDLKSRPENLTVGDFGCGDAQIAQSVSQTVHSFDLCALNEHVTVCDMEKVPLKNNCLDVAIFCLSLMGTNWISYIKEANRVLKMKGQLKIAEVASRFASVADFLKIMKQLGFKKESKDFSNKMFLMFDFTKEASTKKVELERGEVLKPCLYKRR